MLKSTIVISKATAETFDEKGYLLVNPDVSAHAKRPGDARRHFENHGVHEGRQTVTREFIVGAQARGRAKYDRFAPILDAQSGVGGAFRHLDDQGCFPVSYGEKPYAITSYESESANCGLGEFVREVEAHPERNYLDIGCGLRNQVYENCLYLEVYPSITADIVMEPACRYPIASGSLDGVCCLAVLEHVEQPWIVAEEIRRMLKPGGLAFIDWPFLQPVHGYPSHFYNATRSGLSALFQDGFEQIVLDTLSNQTPDHTLNWILREWSAALTSEPTRAELLGMTVADLMREAPGSPFWRRVLAATPDKAKMTFACGNTLIARKSGDTPREAVTDRRPAHTPRPTAADAAWWNLFRRRNIKAKD